jgi:chemotaxis protein CheD
LNSPGTPVTTYSEIPSRYLEPTAPSSATYVHPGRLAASAGAEPFTTVVGSGAVVCLWDPIRRVGGMAHFLLPETGGAPAATRYGDVAMRSLLEQLNALGGRSYRGCVHGGSAPPIHAETGHLGDRNVAVAISFLRLHGIPLVQHDVGGAGGRKIVFDPVQGAVQVSRVGA